MTTAIDAQRAFEVVSQWDGAWAGCAPIDDDTIILFTNWGLSPVPCSLMAQIADGLSEEIPGAKLLGRFKNVYSLGVVAHAEGLGHHWRAFHDLFWRKLEEFQEEATGEAVSYSLQRKDALATLFERADELFD